MSVLQGDMTRIGDLFGYFVILSLCVGVTGTLVIAGLYTALLKPDHVVHIDPERRILTVRYDLPWRNSRSVEYRFDQIEAVELKYDSEQNEILLRLPDRRRPLTLMSIFRPWAAETKFRHLKEMGLPVR
ncbi:hypothetical protein [Actibacterium ureilyticum]|uniref:hypothetical protein n=1 Tax=Actibacterium ureilyticum TaxID=1590614 RepID=UPI0011409A41|nr:hypothetical protein [Actibacterium ureilyticum]